jgi:hypothetical protein
VNQLYWKSKPVYERLMKSGDALRSAQIAALKGRTTELPRASEAHKKALAEAVREATKIAAAEVVNPGAEELARMLDALSLAPARPHPPGRLTELVQPAGFEALAGVSMSGLKSADTLKIAGSLKGGHRDRPPKGGHDVREEDDEGQQRAERAAQVEREREAARQRKEAEHKLKAAEQTLERTRAAEARARDAFESAQEDRGAAEAALFAARKAVRDL